MKVHEFCVVALMMSLLFACQPPSLGELAPACDPAVEVCPPGFAPESGSSEDVSTHEPGSGEDASTHEPGTTTGQEADTATTSSANSGSTGELAVPSLIEAAVIPNPVEYSGPVTVTAQAEHADGVRMQVGDAQIELVQTTPGEFVGEFAVYSGLSNGLHEVTLTPRREGVSGATAEAPYAIALPEPGSQAHWETGNVIGQGQVAALATTPDRRVIELGTSYTNEGARCYLRRRDKAGAWSQSDVVEVFPGQTCNAIDLVVDAQGAISLLVNLKVGNGMRWRLARIAAWGVEPENRGFGLETEIAVALALHSSGTLGACGYGKTPAGEDDALAWVFPPNLAGETRSFDYVSIDKKDWTHLFSERARDCVFVGDTLTLVGEASGPHEGMFGMGDRLFILRTGDDALDATWYVAPPGEKTQSGGQAVDVDDLGRLLIGAFRCDDACQPESELRIYNDTDELVYLAPLGSFPTTEFAVRDLAWSPAGYAVVVTGGLKGNEAAFTVRAFDPMKIDPVWTFVRKDGGVFHTALALGIGLFGEVYAGGLGEGSYPAFAIVNG